MWNWMRTLALTGALSIPAAVATAQDAPAPPPPPQPAHQPGDDEAAAQEQAELSARLRILAEQERQRADEMRGRAEELRATARARVLGPVKREKAAWLGVSTSPVPRSLREHLQLKHKYIGLLVERVEPESPAAQAGVEQFDIIERVNDQWIVNTEQFSVVLRMHEPGTEVNLDVIRKGQPQQIKVTLAEKELPVLGMNEFQFFDLAGVQAGAVGAGGGANVFQWAPEGRVIIRDPANFEQLLQLERIHGASNSTVIVTDTEHSIKVTTRNGKKSLEVSDPTGVVIFSGPINTEEERAALPPDIAQKLGKFDDLAGVSDRKPEAATPPDAPKD